MSFYDHLERYGSAVALVAEDGEEHTYASLAASADAWGSLLHDRGLVFVLAGNNLASVVGYLGCLRTKRPVALLAANLHSELLPALLTAYRPAYIWAPKNRAGDLPNAKVLHSFAEYVLVAGWPCEQEMHQDLALLMTTSGSTGSRKFVRLSHGNVAANAASIAGYLAIRPEDRAITALPMHYVYGLSVLNSHFEAGASVLLQDASLMEKRFWQRFAQEKVTSLAGVPYTFELLKRLRWTRMELPLLRVLTQAGGKLNAELVKEFAADCAARGIVFYVMYGASEATARMAYLPPARALDKPGSIGGPIPGGRLWLEDAEGKTVSEPHAVGELFYAGPNVFMGYAQSSADLALGDVNGQVLATGDLATRDADGFYFIVGRKGRSIKVFGNRVNLDEVEQLLAHAGVACACGGRDDRICIYTTADERIVGERTGGEPEKEVLAAAQRLTHLHPSAFRMVVVDRIPRNEAGKILYAELPDCSL